VVVVVVVVDLSNPPLTGEVLVVDVLLVVTLGGLAKALEVTRGANANAAVAAIMTAAITNVVGFINMMLKHFQINLMGQIMRNVP
jgi:hypothetical protein